MCDLATALAAWSELLGPEQVIRDETLLAAAQTATFATTHRIPAIVRPGSREDVQRCLEIANRYHVPVYPISGGKNWGNGSRVPPQDNCVLLDLGRMDRILDFDEDLAYVTIEPGVTFGRLYAFLREKGSSLMTGTPGTTPEASVIGNTLERGHGGGLQVDRFAHVCGLEVVLPTGECIHSGFARFPHAKAAPLHPYGVGPSLDGLFTQSNFGVVTKMTLWLVPIPRHVQSCIFRIHDDERLAELLPRVRRLRALGTLTGLLTIWNRYKGLSLQSQYPWPATNGSVPLPPHLASQLPDGDMAWTGLAGLYAHTKRQAKEQRETVRRALEPVADQIAIGDDTRVRIYRDESASPFRGRLNMRDPRQSLFLGVPNPASIVTTYWRKPTPPPQNGADPDRDRVGLIWSMPALPFTPHDVRTAVAFIESTCLECGLEPNIALICVSERAIDATVLLMYDRDVPGEDARALACHDRLIHGLIDRGYLPYRLGIQSMDALPPAVDDTDQFLGRLKSAIDPNGILAPGRYVLAGTGNDRQLP